MCWLLLLLLTGYFIRVSPSQPNLPTYSTLLYLRQKLMYAFRSIVTSSRRCGCSYTSSCSSCINKNATYVRRALHNIDDHTVLVVDVVVVVVEVEVESLHPHQPGV